VGAATLGLARSTCLAVLALDEAPARAQPQGLARLPRAVSEDGVPGLVLGCAGMGGSPAAFAGPPPVRLIDGVHAAVRIAALLPPNPTEDTK